MVSNKSVTLTGRDTITIGNVTGQRVLNSLGDGDCAALTYPNNISVTKRGKDGTGIVAYNQDGNIANLTLRIIKGSDDDKILQSYIDSYHADPAGFLALSGTIVKRLGDGQGNLTREIYPLAGGVPEKNVETKTNENGDTEQVLSVYVFNFLDTERGLM